MRKTTKMFHIQFTEVEESKNDSKNEFLPQYPGGKSSNPPVRRDYSKTRVVTYVWDWKNILRSFSRRNLLLLRMTRVEVENEGWEAFWLLGKGGKYPWGNAPETHKRHYPLSHT